MTFLPKRKKLDKIKKNVKNREKLNEMKYNYISFNGKIVTKFFKNSHTLNKCLSISFVYIKMALTKSPCIKL